MKNSTTTLVTITAVAACFIFSSFEVPKDWFIAGSQPKAYKIGIDKGAGKDGDNAATIQSKDDKIKGFGTLMQNCKPDKYRGKRIRMTGWMKTENVKSWAGFWLRIDKPDSDIPFAMDNMGKRPIKGTNDWTKYEIVLDVPEETSNLAYGALLDGTGKIWLDDITFEIVDETVPTTFPSNEELARKKLTEPANLSFEE